jgi:hypothetical protein
MRKALAWFAVAAILIAVSAQYGKDLKRKQALVAEHLHKVPLHTSESHDNESHDTPSPASQGASPEAQTANQLVTVAGPLANWTQNGDLGQQESSDKQEGSTEERLPYTPHPNDHIVHTELSSTGVVLHKTLAVASDQNVSFEIPPHIVSPRLSGKYRSYLRGAGMQASDATANVDFFLMNGEQYADFRDGHPAVALFSAEGSRNQAVNFDLPPSMDQPVKYYLVFRSSGGESKKTVEANFKVDF